MDFTVSQDGKVIILLRPQKITANGVQQFDLDAFLQMDQQVITLVDNASNIQNIAVSPDGGYVAFTQQGAEGAKIFISPVATGNQPQVLGSCNQNPQRDALL